MEFLNSEWPLGVIVTAVLLLPCASERREHDGALFGFDQTFFGHCARSRAGRSQGRSAIFVCVTCVGRVSRESNIHSQYFAYVPYLLPSSIIWHPLRKLF